MASPTPERADKFSNEEELEMELKEPLLEEEDTALPTPVQATAPKSKPKLSAAAIIPVWIVLSLSVIIYNNYLYNTLNFKFPVWLVTWHLTFAVSAYSHVSAEGCDKNETHTDDRNAHIAAHNALARRRQGR